MAHSHTVSSTKVAQQSAQFYLISIGRRSKKSSSGHSDDEERKDRVDLEYE